MGCVSELYRKDSRERQPKDSAPALSHKVRAVSERERQNVEDRKALLNESLGHR